jgi:hypothetical protein
MDEYSKYTISLSSAKRCIQEIVDQLQYREGIFLPYEKQNELLYDIQRKIYNELMELKNV